MKQTALEWLEDNLIGNPFSEEDFEHNRNMFRKAKEMEKGQIIDAHKHGFSEGTCFGSTTIYKFVSAEEYYNETFNTKEK